MAIPGSLVTAHENLLRVIPQPLTAEEEAERVRTGKALPEVDPSALHDATRRFVDALSVDPAATAELNRRGTLCATLTADGSEYAIAAKKTQKVLAGWNLRAQFAIHPVYLDFLERTIRGLFHFEASADLVAELKEKGKSMTISEAFHVCPERLAVEIVAPEELVAEVRNKHDRMNRLLAVEGLPEEIRAPLEAWRDAAWSIVSQGENESLDGCYRLLHAENLQDALIVPAAAPEVRQAAEALVRWQNGGQAVPGAMGDSRISHRRVRDRPALRKANLMSSQSPSLADYLGLRIDLKRTEESLTERLVRIEEESSADEATVAAVERMLAHKRQEAEDDNIEDDFAGGTSGTDGSPWRMPWRSHHAELISRLKEDGV